VTTVAGLATRQRLLAAARELIEDGGYASASVVAIAERAGVASGTLYRHFTSKEDLFVDVFRSVCSHEERAMVAAAESLPAGAAANCGNGAPVILRVRCLGINDGAFFAKL